MSEHRTTFHRRVQRGIPTEYRWAVWRAAMNVDARAIPGIYQHMVQVESQWQRVVEIDISRTFPDMPLFDKEQQHSLLRILHAYANYNPDVGYCQGMNFVAGLLMYVSMNEDFGETPRLEKEEEAFWLLVCLMEDGGLSGFYKRHFPLLRRYLWAFDELLVEHLPELHDHFNREHVQHAVYLHQWFLTLYINCLPRPMVLVFWDVIVCSGLELILPMTVSLLKVHKDTLLSLEFEDMIRFFKAMRLCEDPNCNAEAIACSVVAGGSTVTIPQRVLERLQAPLVCNEFDGDASPMSPMERGPPADIAATSRRAVSATDGSSSFGLAASYLNRLSSRNFSVPTFGDLGRVELPQGVLSWWEDARESLEKAAETATCGTTMGVGGRTAFPGSDCESPAMRPPEPGPPPRMQPLSPAAARQGDSDDTPRVSQQNLPGL